MQLAKYSFYLALLGLFALSFSVLMAHYSIEFFLGLTDMELGMLGTWAFILPLGLSFWALLDHDKQTEQNVFQDIALFLCCQLFAALLLMGWLFLALCPFENYISNGLAAGSYWLIDWIKIPTIVLLFAAGILSHLTGLDTNPPAED